MSAWEQSLLDWNTKHVDMDGQHWDIMVCADCLHRYKRTSDFCPLCFKFYPAGDEDSSSSSCSALQLPLPLQLNNNSNAIRSMAKTIEHSGSGSGSSSVGNNESSPPRVIAAAVEEIVKMESTCPAKDTSSSSGSAYQKTDLNDEHMVPTSTSSSSAASI